jgi:hypothetical protein
MDWLAYLLVALVLVVLCGWALMAYQKHSRIARRRSLAALNQLLAEADEIERRSGRDSKPIDEPEAPSDGGQ